MDSTNRNDELNDNEKCVDVDNIVNNCDKLNIKKRERRLSSGSENISDVKREKLLSSDSSKADGSGDFHAADDGEDVDKRLTVETVNTNDESSCDGLEMPNPDDDPEFSPFDRLKNTSTPSTSDTCARIKIYKNRNYRHHSQTDETTQTSTADRDEEEHIEVLRNVDVGSDGTHDTTAIREDVDNSNTVSMNESESEVEEEDDDDIRSLIKQPPKPNWFPVQEIIKRQVGYRLNSQSSALFQRRCYGSLHCAKRLQLFRKLEKHRGCVNCLNFHHDGSVLASGSDDLKIIIWDWKRGKSLISFDSKHKENVFQCKFLPLSGDLHIVSCARDGQVRLSQISIQEGLRSNRNLFTHRKSCHKLAILKNQPHVILSAGEDGVVMSQDVRESSPTELLTVDESEHRAVIPLYSINAHPLNSYEFCICGQNPHVRTYDQRRCDSPLNTYFAPNPNGNTTSDGFEKVQVSCAVYNHNGSEILASYNDGDIFLFDTNGAPGTFVHRYQGHRNAATIKGVNFFGPKSEFIVSGSDCGNIFLWEKNTESIVNYMSADESGVVNCLEPHPQLPFMCTSGLDWDVKVWMPMAPEDATLPNLVDQLKANKNFNSLMMGNLSEDQMLWLLWRRLYHTENELDNLMNDIRTENADFLSTHSTSSLNSDDSEETEEDFHSGCYNS